MSYLKRYNNYRIYGEVRLWYIHTDTCAVGQCICIYILSKSRCGWLKYVVSKVYYVCILQVGKVNYSLCVLAYVV